MPGRPLPRVTVNGILGTRRFYIRIRGIPEPPPPAVTPGGPAARMRARARGLVSQPEFSGVSGLVVWVIGFRVIDDLLVGFVDRRLCE